MSDDQYKTPCANCETVCNENVHIYCIKKDAEEEVWCSGCFHDCWRDLKREGWECDDVYEDETCVECDEVVEDEEGWRDSKLRIYCDECKQEADNYDPEDDETLSS